MVPDDEVGVAVVDLGQVRGLVPLQLGGAPLDVAPASHQRGHRPLTPRLLFDSSGCSWLLDRRSSSDRSLLRRWHGGESRPEGRGEYFGKAQLIVNFILERSRIITPPNGMILNIKISDLSRK